MFAGMLLAATLAAAPALPPTPRFRHYGMADGLPSSRIYTTVQDAQGYVWIGAQDGLARFDGREFRVWRHHADDATSLASNDVSALLVDQHGAVFAGGEGGGLNRLDPDGHGFRHWRHGPAPDSLAGDDVTSLAQAPDGTLYVGMYAAGVDRLRGDQLGFEHLRHDPADPSSLVSDNVLSLLVDHAGRLWIGTDAGLDLREPDGRLRHIRFVGEDQPLYVWQVAEDAAGVRVASGAGLFLVGPDDVARRWPADAPRQPVFASLRTPDGQLWVAARGELRLYDQHGRVNDFPPQPLRADSLHGRLPFGLMRDREGALWVSMLDAGIAYLEPRWRQFSLFGHVPEDAASLAVVSVLALAPAAQGGLLVGGEDALDRFDPATGVVTHLADAAELKQVAVLAIAAEGPRIWIGTQQGLRVLANGRVRSVVDPRLRHGVRRLLVLADGDVLASTASDGIVRIAAASLQVTTVASPGAVEGADETHGLVLAGGTVWRATDAGVQRLRADGLRFDRIPGVSPGRVTAMATDGKLLWLVRPDRLEAYRIGPDALQPVRILGSADGWPGIDVGNIVIGGQGQIWLPSRTGLWSFDPDSNRFRHYTINGGAQGPEFGGGVTTLPGGVVFAGTLHGIVGFHTDTTFAPAQAPHVALTAARVHRDGSDVGLAVQQQALDLRWDDRDLEVTAQALSFIDPQHLRYRFRMDGFDQDWVNTGNNGSREFTGLGAGDYVLRIAAANAGSDWTELPPLAVRVATPPWLRPWAWALYALAAMVLLALAWRVARQRVDRRLQLGLLRQQRQLAEDASAAKTRFLATLGHEIRTPMTGVLGMAELLTHTTLDARQQGFVDAIGRSGSVLLKLVNDALDLARIEAGKLDLEAAPVDPVAILDEVLALESGLAQAKGLDLRRRVDSGVPPRVMGDAVRIRQILTNLLNNAVKFTPSGAVRAALAVHDGMLVYSVADNGPGMTETLRQRLFHRFEQGDSGSHSGGSGLGLAICRELATLMGGRIEVESELGRGSTFSAWLPLPTVAAADGVPQTTTAAVVAQREILVVDDDATVAAVIAGLLESRGHVVRCVGDALAALTELQLQSAEVVLVDLDLPDMDGFQLVRMLRARADGARMAILVVTARTAGDDEARARDAGADAFVRKPVSGARLGVALAEAERVRSQRDTA